MSDEIKAQEISTKLPKYNIAPAVEINSTKTNTAAEDVKVANEDGSASATDGSNAVAADNNAGEENTCVVCFKNVEIFSIGECDHPVCYECSTRMRVLCSQNECPICRQVLAKVIFTYDKLPYRELERKNRSEYYSKKYKIGFYNSAIQQKFFELLDHPCPKCDCPPYRTFQGLRNHVRREHDLHYCDLCVENLKIFTFERRCYTQTELGLHRTKGDADNRSHRGHPLCEYCNKRYLDRDELFRHLRREHYYCHFCDADGCNDFYKDYDALAEHFRRDHYLCEEGRCATEQFIGAFRTEIDYKAHVATAHGKTLNKQQAKQTRTLQLEITLGPRGRSGQNEPHILGVRSRAAEREREREREQYEEPPEFTQSQLAAVNQRAVTIDAANEQDFPSLAGAGNAPSVSLVRPPPPSMRRSGFGGLARTKENFPALGGSGGGGQANGNQRGAPAISAVARRAADTTMAGASARPMKAASTNNSNTSNGMVIHVSNRPTSTSNGNNTNSKKANTNEFPALPGGSSKVKKNTRVLEEDMVPSTSSPPLTNISAKHRTLVDDYVSVANPTNFQKIQLVQKEDADAKARKAAEQLNAPKLTARDFPSLAPSASGNTTTGGNANKANWNKPGAERKQRELENRKAKVAPAPQLSKENKLRSANVSNGIEQPAPSKKDKKPKDNQKDKKLTNENNKMNGKPKENNNNNNENKTMNLNTTTTSGNKTAATPMNDTNSAARPPPGFNAGGPSLKPPPGFLANVTVNSVAKSPNNLTFTSSLGETYSIIPARVYSPPQDFQSRNQKVVSQFRQSLKTPEALEEFRQISQNFRDGMYKTQGYYEHCQAALKEHFDRVFPELLALLPDISKQQALYLVHQQRLNTLTPDQRKSLPQLEVCSRCKQVLLQHDSEYHKRLHAHDENFPTLNKKASQNARK